MDGSGIKCESVFIPARISALAFALKSTSVLISIFKPGIPTGIKIGGGLIFIDSSKKVKAPPASKSYPSSPSLTPFAFRVYKPPGPSSVPAIDSKYPFLTIAVPLTFCPAVSVLIVA